MWSEIEHWTGNELIETLQLVSDEDEASSFMETYTAACDDESHAEHNLRYIFSLIDSDEAERLSELFMVDVPDPDDDPIEPRQWWANSSMGVKS